MAEHLFQTPVSAVSVPDARAGFWRRFVAAFVDGVLITAGALAIQAVAGKSTGVMVLTGVLGLAYIAVLEGTSGQALGKRAMAIRVVDADTGEPIGVPRGVGRYFGRLVSTVVVYLGYLWMLWDPNKQTWHDKMVSSVVVPVD